MQASGVYLIVSNFDDPVVVDVLRPTKGGYPHITLMYAGSDSEEDIGEIAVETLNELVMGERPLTSVALEAAFVSLSSFHEKSTARDRHDVLIYLNDNDSAAIERLRKELALDTLKDIVMRRPHVTHSIHYTKEEAEAAAATLRSQLPLQVFITGVVVE
jgi:hypothetical protein